MHAYNHSGRLVFIEKQIDIIRTRTKRNKRYIFLTFSSTSSTLSSTLRYDSLRKKHIQGSHNETK